MKLAAKALKGLANEESILNLEKLIMRSADYYIIFLSVGRRMSKTTCKKELP
jgi:hypothetical protein